MHIYTIYKATNLINGKIYIGFDSNWPKRQNDHKLSSSNPKRSDYKLYFHSSIRKHGWDNFSWEPIYQSLDWNYTLNTMEPHFIKEYNSYHTYYQLEQHRFFGVLSFA
jgi:hypothetical protein